MTPEQSMRPCEMLSEKEQFNMILRVAQCDDRQELAHLIGQFYLSFVIDKIKPALISKFDQEIDLQSIDDVLQEIAEKLMREVIVGEFTPTSENALCYWCSKGAYRRLTGMIQHACANHDVCLDDHEDLEDPYDLEAFDPFIAGNLENSLRRIRSPQRQQAFALFIRGWTAEEIALELNKELATVKKILYRAFREVRTFGILPRP